MKKFLFKSLLFIIGIILVMTISFTVYYLIITKDYRLEDDKLVNLDETAEIFDEKGNFIESLSGDISVTDFNNIPDITAKAFIAIEDKRFYSHNGIDIKGLIRAAFNNVKSFSFKEGASTISQQLVKNTHLSSEKTLNRKLAEIKLTMQLEKKYSKDQILEKYLNTIYFGNGCYGITSAAKRYFGVAPCDLSLNQSAILAATIKAPATYSPLSNPDKCFERKNLVLEKMYEQGFISKNEYENNIKLKEDAISYEENNSAYINLIKRSYDDIIEKTGKPAGKCKIYTYYDQILQNTIENTVSKNPNEYDKAIIVLNKENNVKAYYSTCIEQYRQMGSTIKPLLVYAPAIEENVIDACSIINDEKTDFGGYTPSNYNGKYYGYVSAKFALAKSLNTCAVKILNSTGIEKSKKYLQKTEIPLTENDNSLRIALGSTEKGATLLNIASAYGLFPNKGFYCNPCVIAKIVAENGKTIYATPQTRTKVFGEDTSYIINDALSLSVTEGTAKKLSDLNIPLCAKTGTVGNENGNTDAYSVTYNNDYTVACWYGIADSSLMPNSVSGGTLPTTTVYEVWKSLIDNGYTPNHLFYTDKIKEINIDKISYNENHKIEIADKNSPLRYVSQEIFKLNRIPKEQSLRFSLPKIEMAKIQVINNEIKISLCLSEYYDYKIFRYDGKEKVEIFNSSYSINKKSYTDLTAIPNTRYIYSILPYVKANDIVKEGEEIFLPEIKTPTNDVGDKWWYFD